MMRNLHPLVVLIGAGLAALFTGCSLPSPATSTLVDAPAVLASASTAASPATSVSDADASSYDQFILSAEDRTADGARTPDVVYVPTPSKVVDAMLTAAQVGSDDVLYDLGSGDGRIPITAARRWGTRGIGIDIDPERIEEANLNAQRSNVTNKVRFIEGDLFEADLSEATVISLYLLPSLNLRLRPTLLKLKPGTRIVSHAFDMDDWEPEQTINVGGATVYRWTVPETVPSHLR